MALIDKARSIVAKLQGEGGTPCLPPETGEAAQPSKGHTQSKVIEEAMLASYTQRIADLADAWHERMAIVLEAGDIGEAEAHLIAEAEIGRQFVAAFMPSEQAS